MGEERAANGKAGWLARLELRILQAVSSQLPSNLSPINFAFTTLAGAMAVFFGFVLSHASRAALILCFFGFVVYWLGRNLQFLPPAVRDNVRQPIDLFASKITELLSAFAILIGMGLSPWVRMDVALGVLAIYLLLEILYFLRAGVLNQRELVLGKGAGLALLFAAAVLLLWMVAGSAAPVTGWFGGFSLFDWCFIVVVICALGVWIAGTSQTGALLAKMEPPQK